MTATTSTALSDHHADLGSKRVFQCACGASRRAEFQRAYADGWRSVWQRTKPDAEPESAEPPRPAGLLLRCARMWRCPECAQAPVEEYVKDPQSREEAMSQSRQSDYQVHRMLLFPGHVLGVALTACTASKGPERPEPASARRTRYCSLFSPLYESGAWALACSGSPGPASEPRRLLPLPGTLRGPGGVLLLSLPGAPRRGRRCAPAASRRGGEAK